MYLRVTVSKEILDKPVDGHHESTAKEVDKDYDLTGVGGRDVLAKGTLVDPKLLRHQKSPNHQALDVLLCRRRHLPWRIGDEILSPLLFELISSSPTELMVLVFLARVFLDAIATAGSRIIDVTTSARSR
jgi:hypothetical protein